MDNATELRKQLEANREEIRSLSETETLNEEQETRLSTLLDEFKPLEERVGAAETRAQEVERIKATQTRADSGYDGISQITRTDPFAVDVRTATREDIEKRAMEVMETRGHELGADQQRALERLVKSRGSETNGTQIAQRMLLTDNDAYRSAFAKAVQQTTPLFTAEEQGALQAFRDFERATESRAMSDGTTTAGGFGLPVLIDPSIILTSGALAAPLLDKMRKIQITTNQWKGVSSAGMSFAYTAENTAVADGTPTLAQPTIPVYTARGFIPYSLEVEMDYPDLQGELQNLLAQGYINLLATKTMTGSGSSEPKGLFTAMQNETSAPAHVTVTTAGTIGATDIRKVWAALPEKFRANATYVMSVSVENQIRGQGNNNALADYTVNQTQEGLAELTGRAIVRSDYAPTFNGVTTTASHLVVGDLSNFVLIQRAGMSVELVPHLFDTSTGRPLGERGLFAYARNGFDVVNLNSCRLLSNN